MYRTSTYLNFSRNTEQAFNFYKKVFCSDFVGGVHRFEEVPLSPGQAPLSESDRKLIMHIELPILGGHRLMGTDAPESKGFKLQNGNNVYINLETETRQETDDLFNALSEGGRIEMPLQEMFWGAYYGSCTDRFGVKWMFNCDPKLSLVGKMPVDPALDLVFERITPLSVAQLWRGWTHEETLMKWFCPKPWNVTSCKIDLVPGGAFYTVMEGPNGERMPNKGIYLELQENRKLVFTNCMDVGYRPLVLGSDDFAFSATLLFSPSSEGTLYRATVRHASLEGKLKHQKMGFQEGWGMALTQLEKLFLA